MLVALTLCTTCTTCPHHLGQLLAELQRQYGAALEIELQPCLAACDAAPAAFINDTYYPRIELHNLAALIDAEAAAAYGQHALLP